MRQDYRPLGENRSDGEKGGELLRAVHGVPTQKIEVVPHGIPEFPFREPDHAKAQVGFRGKSVILTFGLLSPSKGIETVIDAMPEIIRACPMPSMLFSAQPIQTWCANRERPIARA